MAVYRLFFIRDGEPVGQITRHCSDDLDALDAARQMSRDYTVEVYAETRLVARVKQGDAPLSLKDKHSL